MAGFYSSVKFAGRDDVDGFVGMEKGSNGGEGGAGGVWERERYGSSSSSSSSSSVLACLTV